MLGASAGNLCTDESDKLCGVVLEKRCIGDVISAEPTSETEAARGEEHQTGYGKKERESKNRSECALVCARRWHCYVIDLKVE